MLETNAARSPRMAGSSITRPRLQFDNPEAREAHHYPIDPEQKEVKEMLSGDSQHRPPLSRYQIMNDDTAPDLDAHGSCTAGIL